MNSLSSKEQEVMDILQEECAEVIQVISKIRRFGIDIEGPTGETNREQLTKEVGDVQAMLALCYQFGILNPGLCNVAMHKKLDKLHTWSNIFK